MSPAGASKPAPAAAETEPAVALVGTPNCGKTTLFNALTGMRQKVGNYPGVTVEKKEGWFARGDQALRLVDLPGLYGLEAHTPEETVAEDLLRGRGRFDRPPAALLVVLDGSALERSLALLRSVLDLGLPVAAILTMADEIKARGGRLDIGALSRDLGLPVVAVVGHRGVGLEEARALLASWRSWPLPKTESKELSPAERYAWAGGALERSLGSALRADTLTARLDRWVLHPVAGPLIFLGVMTAFFQAIFSGAQPAMDALDALVGLLGDAAQRALPPGLLQGFVVHGVIQGVGSVVAFLPQIAILFFFLFLLEDIGYLARAAFLMDRVMGWAGLQGRCFVALLSSYACAVPGIMATRGIPSPQDRLATMLVAPFMTCSARLPVYALLIGAFVPDRPVLGVLRAPGLALLALYVLGSLSAFAAAWLLRRSLLSGDITPFYIELPPYRFPTWRSVAVAMLDRARIFLRRAGTVILGVSVLTWVLLNVPRLPEGQAGAAGTRADLQMRHSLAGRIGAALEPVFAPLGFDWRINVALLGSFVAREVAVSTLAQIYAADENDGSLRAILREGRDAEGRPLMPLPAALALVAFFVYALQCVSTLAVLRRETNGWKWPAFAFGAMFVCAWSAGALTRLAALSLGL
ncbi:MAG: ferrous iron transporter B [Elusimicrobia bacterium]|nr:ferrous iron transporter B [Elusimicrobiota bacterium]